MSNCEPFQLSWEELHSFVKGLLKSRECSFCHQKVKILLNHHYPIPESLGGRETVKICSRCHAKDHRLYPDWLILRLIDEIEGRRMPDFDMFGEEPHAERKKLIQEAMKRAVEKPKFLGDEDDATP